MTSRLGGPVLPAVSMKNACRDPVTVMTPPQLGPAASRSTAGSATEAGRWNGPSQSFGKSGAWNALLARYAHAAMSTPPATARAARRRTPRRWRSRPLIFDRRDSPRPLGVLHALLRSLVSPSSARPVLGLAS